MNAQTLGLLNKAERAIAATESLLRDGLPEFACGRAYYSMFYVAEALPVEEGLRFRKHSGVHAAFGARFAATSEMDPKFHRWLLDAFDAVSAVRVVRDELSSKIATMSVEEENRWLRSGEIDDPKLRRLMELAVQDQVHGLESRGEPSRGS